MTTDAAMRILLVDDDLPFRTALADSFSIAGLEIESFGDGQSALESLFSGQSPHELPAVVVTDLRMPRFDGHALLSAVLARDPELPVILMTGHGDIAMAVAALKQGAFDFIAKPFPTDHLIASVRRAMETRRLVLENRRLRQAVAEVSEGFPLVGESPAMLRLRDTMRQLARVEVDVLIEGETGTGKALVARQLHRWSMRSNRPLVTVDCAALPEQIADEVLFGTRIHRGQIAEADRGTLFLDEIDSLAPALQARLLSVVQDRVLHGNGGVSPREVDLRIIAATKADLRAEVAAGRFRADLLYRLETVRLRIPPLRERREDLGVLLSIFLDEAASFHDRPRPVLNAPVLDWLLRHDWPGNVRELQNYAVQLTLGLRQDGRMPAEAGTIDMALSAQMDRFEEGLLRDTLARLGGDVSAAAVALNLPRRSLYARLSRHGINPAPYRKQNA
ncbi:two-component system C4-dicarboxylate transport response regulator DctD [Aquamicrobium lusatiense]|uniref:Two-component system C4-dicarboxylate transport response regulator DctD n=1 Tax=Aquamicrobium lusatiense TaxID=89772 RepID=A0A7W9S6Z6_9HYPH|nr:sigma-54 dependent transcriptional regulator [Aquamicrobium lusatiense]MBB6014153.1 two-component system C4-dicarboxylate transport response regulator DctD [Aquamicrobium lusatiense]